MFILAHTIVRKTCNNHTMGELDPTLIRVSQTRMCCNLVYNRESNEQRIVSATAYAYRLFTGHVLLDDAAGAPTGTTCVHFLPAQGGRGREVIHPLLRPSYFQLLLSGGGAAPATGRRREAQLLPTNNQDLSRLERDGDNRE